MRVSVLDLGVGNLRSIANALMVSGAEVAIDEDPTLALRADAMVLPGVGSFEPAARRLTPYANDVRAAVARGLPTLGICLGMQLLFERSDEGCGAGLGVFGGSVRRLAAAVVPQIGWNAIDEARDPLLELSGLETAYYANSFVCAPESDECIGAWTTHESDRFPAVVRRGAVVGVQFHPEKSSHAGLRFLQAFLEEARQ
jgi:glutamine amidotransferase